MVYQIKSEQAENSNLRFEICSLPSRNSLAGHDMGEFDSEIALIISNHTDLGFLAERYHIPFHIFPITKENKALQENKELELIQTEKIDTIILARYMQVLSPTLVENYVHNILNIHHSFLPAFAGANPYKQAYKEVSRLSERLVTM